MLTRGTLYDLLGDLVVFRNLEPMDRRLAGLRRIWSDAGLETYRIPRKAEPAYAAVVYEFLSQAQGLRSPEPLRRAIYIGDTRMNDGMAIANLNEHLPVRGFIAAEEPHEPKRIAITDEVMYANRWGALRDFREYLEAEKLFPDASTAAIIDLDKTAFGARGRNSQAIDAARVAAAYRTVKEALNNADFSIEEFRRIYDKLNRPEFHFFTADNQDYLVYICLMAAGGVYSLPELLDDLEARRLQTFSDFITACSHRPIPAKLRPLHQEVYLNFTEGDPTPFKSFRYREYEETIARMDTLPDDVDEGKILTEEIVLTREVFDFCRFLAKQGALLVGLTDKPDEASIPRPALAHAGYLPLHQVTMKIVGEPLDF